MREILYVCSPVLSASSCRFRKPLSFFITLNFSEISMVFYNIKMRNYSFLLGLLSGMFTVSIIAAQQNCDHLGVRVYEDMDCTPKYDPCSSECPAEFTCPNLHKSTTECYFRNHTLKIDQWVNQSDLFCYSGCRCEEGTKFLCIILGCPEYFGITPPPGCYNTYNLERCCAVDEICGDSNVTCTYGDETYKEGIRFYPKDSCATCVCQKGFRGKIEAPFCTRRKCDVQLDSQENIQGRCAPAYHLYDRSGTTSDILCCPDNWICPAGNETILGTSKSDKICYFGERELKYGQRIEQYVGTTLVSCECKIPPLLTCLPKK